MFNINYLETKYRNSDFSLYIENLKVNPGEIICLIGANGSGKSTFYRALCHSGEQIRSEFIVNGVTHSSLLDSELRIGFHNAFAPLIQSLTVYQNLIFIARLFGVANFNETITDLCVKFRVSNLLSNYPNDLSAGQQHKIKLISALLPNPDVLLLDEPSTASDIESIETILGFIKDFNKNGDKVIIVSTHHVYEIEQLKPRLIGLAQGKIKLDLYWHELPKNHLPRLMKDLVSHSDIA